MARKKMSKGLGDVKAYYARLKEKVANNEGIHSGIRELIHALEGLEDSSQKQFTMEVDLSEIDGLEPDEVDLFVAAYRSVLRRLLRQVGIDDEVV